MISKAYFLYRKLSEDDIWSSSAALAYYLMLSFFPFVIVLVSLVAFLPFDMEEILNIIRTYVPENIFALIRENSQILANGRVSILSVGFVSMIWASSKGSKALIRAINKSYRSENRRAPYKRIIIAPVLTLSIIALVVVSAALFIFSNQIISLIGLSDIQIYYAEKLRSVTLYAALVALMAVFFKIVPDRKLTYKSVIPGALLTGIIWIFATVAFSIYLDKSSRFSFLYGTLGSFIALMLWLYLLSFSMLFGNALNAFWLDYHKKF